MLSIPKLDQPIQLVLNQEKEAHLGVQIHALSEEADDDTAEVLQGLYRRIEVDSRAHLARSWAFERAVKAGRGGWRVLKEYDPDGGHKSDQKVVIKRLLYQESMRLDPYAQEPDMVSDADFGFVSAWLPIKTIKRKWPKAKIANMTDSEFGELAKVEPEWLREDKDGKAALVTEYYRKVYGSSGDDQDYVIHWSKLTATDELETSEWDGKYIPLIPAIGRELIPFDGERRWVGIIEPNMDAARMFNYGATNIVERWALENKAPFILAEGQEEGHELEFQLANVRNFPYLRYKPTTVAGQPTAPPQRSQVDIGSVQAGMMMIQQAESFIHAGTGAFEPSLGESSPNAKTKGGTLALQQQHDEGNSNWLDNQAEISFAYEAKVVLDLIPHIYDRPGRIARILDREDLAQTVMLNHPFVLHPKTKRPIPITQQPVPEQVPSPMPPQPGQMQPGQPPPMLDVEHYDLNKGRYGVTVSVGKAYKSRVEQGQNELAQIFQAEPQTFSILGDLYFKFCDFPGHMEASERMKKLLPQPLQDQNDPNAIAQQAAQLQAENQQLKQLLQEAGMVIKTKQVEGQTRIQVEGIKQTAETERADKDREAKLVVAALQGKYEDLNNAMALLREEIGRIGDAAAQARDHAFESAEAEKERAHATGMAAMGASADAGAAAQAHENTMQQADQAHGQALDLQAQQPPAGSG